MKSDDTITNDPNFYDAIVLGAGISGLVSTSLLIEKGYKKILILEEYDHLGGNHINCDVNGYTFDIGCFVFDDTSPLLNHFPELLGTYLPAHPRVSRLNPEGKLTSYPFSLKDDILSKGVTFTIKAFSSLLFDRLFLKNLNNAEDFVRKRIGTTIFTHSGLKYYMHRFYGIRPNEIDVELAEKRMRWVIESTSFKGVFNKLRRRLRRSIHKVKRHQKLVRPKEGFSKQYNIVANSLEKKGVTLKLSQSISSIKKNSNTFEIESGNKCYRSKCLISTIPIEKTAMYCALPTKKNLRTITLVTLFFSFSGDRGFTSSILYNFTNSGAWKRLTVYSDLYGKVHEREYFGVEVVSNFLQSVEDDAERDFRKHASQFGLFKGDLKLEATHTLDNAYPIYSKGATRDAKELVEELRAFGILSHGRQGQFNYQPTAKVSTVEAEGQVTEFLSDTQK